MPRIPLFLAGSMLAAFVVVAQAQARPSAYEIDAVHSHVQFSVERFGFNAIIGEFRDFEGVILLQGDSLVEGAVTATLRTASLVSGDAERDAIVRGGHWLDAARFPTIAFHSTHIAVRDSGSATITGELTLLGVTRPVLLDVTLNKRGIDPSTQREAVGFTATAALRRADFGLTTAAALIGDDVRVRIEAIAHLGT